MAKRKYMKLPNGFGQITKLNQKLRNPYRVMVCIGKTSEGRPISKILKPQGYFSSYRAAYEALVEYNKDPYDLDDDIKVKELYDRWYEEYSRNFKSESYGRTIKSAWAYCSDLYDMRVKEVRPMHIKTCMNSTKSPNTQARIKSLFNLMFDYAMENDFVNKNYARTFNISENTLKSVKDVKADHISFTEEEMKTLWANRHIKYVDIILFQCYSGFRPQEIGLITKDNVHLEERYIIGGMKTNAGINRVVPISDQIYEIVESAMNHSTTKYLFECLEEDTVDKFLTYDKYRRRFDKTINKLHLNPMHRPHDPRKTFVTMAKKAKMDEYAIKKIVGHEISDITEKIYTDRNEDWLFDEMKKINSLCNKSESV